MRRVWIVVAAALMVSGFAGIGPAGAKTAKPVSVDGKVNVKGTKDISAKKAAKIDLEADDFYFAPTFVKVAPGEKVRIELENEGNVTHTFTSDNLRIDQQVAARTTKKFTVTVPSDGTAFEFHCTFHEDMGMQGALYTKAGGTAE